MINIDGHLKANQHLNWTPELRPISEIEPGSNVQIDIPDSSTLQIGENFTTDDLRNVDGSLLDAAVGPIYVKGSEPGDVLEVSIEKLEVASWGWTMVSWDFGFLKHRFRDRLIIWDIGQKEATPRGDFLKGVRIPVSPFLGIIGTAPSTGKHGMIPPQYFGGNMDNRLLGQGSKIYLPVSVHGGLLSVADPHAAQGDGEICGTAIETMATASLKIGLIKNSPISAPRAFSNDNGLGPVIVTMGISPDLHTACSNAVETMIEELKTYGFTDEEAYALCSVTGNLRISEVVDEPNYVVSMLVPKEIARQRLD
ncbi:MAG: acetamidase/formamidase family protein [Thermoplasmataceae archaeon]